MTTEPLKSLGAFTLWSCSGFTKNYWVLKEKYPIVCILTGIASTFMLLFLLSYFGAFRTP